jgi:hypothetical protein
MNIHEKIRSRMFRERLGGWVRTIGELGLSVQGSADVGACTRNLHSPEKTRESPLCLSLENIDEVSLALRLLTARHARPPSITPRRTR